MIRVEDIATNPELKAEVSKLLYHPDIMFWIQDDTHLDEMTVDRFPSHWLWLAAFDEDRLFGFVAFDVRNSAMVELHAAFLPEDRGGNAIIASALGIRWAFDRGFNKALGIPPTDNPAAIKFCEHLQDMIGGQQEGRLTEAFLRNGKYEDILIFGITKKQFEASKWVQ